MSTHTAAEIEDSVMVPDDRELLEPFLRTAAADVFAGIVKKHHALVMSVCRRVVGQAADAEDAYQATFLVLAGRPRSLRRCRSLAGWLYGVAWRTSMRLIRQRRRQAWTVVSDEPPARDPDPLDVIAEENRIAVLDEELNGLPDKYRDVLVMTYFAGRTSQEIADELHETKGAIDGRLRNARNTLRVRLARRGVEIGAIAVAASLISQTAAAAVPELLQSTIALGIQGLNQPVGCPVSAAPLKSLVQPEFAMVSLRAISMFVGGTAIIAVCVGLFEASRHGTGFGSSAWASGPALDAVLPDDEAVPSSVSSAVTQPEAVLPTGSVADSAFVESLVRSSAGQPSFRGYSSARNRAVADQIYSTFEDKDIPQLDFPGDASLGGVMDQLMEFVTSTSGTHINVMLDHKELEPDNITSLSDVMVRDIQLEGISVTSALETILKQTDPELDYFVRDEVLIITTAEAARREENMETRVYDLRPVYAVQHQEHSEDIIEIVEDMTSPPCEWFATDQRGGSMRLIGHNLVVRQSRRGHRAVIEVLEQIQQSFENQ